MVSQCVDSRGGREDSTLVLHNWLFKKRKKKSSLYKTQIVSPVNNVSRQMPSYEVRWRGEKLIRFKSGQIEVMVSTFKTNLTSFFFF